MTTSEIKGLSVSELQELAKSLALADLKSKVVERKLGRILRTHLLGQGLTMGLAIAGLLLGKDHSIFSFITVSLAALCATLWLFHG
ncbi:MAG TPA: hypothetical protein VMB21_10565, partial [Candidatus Limnocylindria bacterium]|nr:hypothetical protein [Candidatus Limnocylindria bacterium]